MRSRRVSATPPPPPAAALSAPVRVRKWCRRLNYAEALNMPVGASIDLDLVKEQEMIAAGLGPRAFRHHAVDHSHTGATTSDHRPFNSGFPVVELVFFSRQRRPWRSPAQRRGGNFDCRCVAIISLLSRQAPW